MGDSMLIQSHSCAAVKFTPAPLHCGAFFINFLQGILPQPSPTEIKALCLNSEKYV